MKVIVERCGVISWFRDDEKMEGMGSVGYVKDGTQDEIISALENALYQARNEKLCWENINRMPNVSTTTS